MSLAHKRSSNSEAFSSKTKRISHNLDASDAAAAFAYEDVHYRTRGTKTITLRFGEKTLAVSCPDTGKEIAAWVYPTLTSLSERWGLVDGWDGYDAVPTNEHIVTKLLTSLFPLMQDDSPAAVITPLADGGIQAEWHINGKSLEIVFSADDAPTYYFYNKATKVEESEKFNGNFEHVRTLLSELSV